MSDTISVYYDPLAATFNIGNHGTLVYTNSETGISEFTTGFPSGPTPGTFTGLASAVIGGAYDVGTNTPAPSFGVLAASSGYLTGPDANLSPTVQNLWINQSTGQWQNSQVLMTGTSGSLAGVMSCLVSAEAGIGAENLTYSALTQNSNSLFATALQICSVPQPTTNGILSGNWTPAAGNILPTPQTTANNDQTLTLTSDSLTDDENGQYASVMMSEEFDEYMYGEGDDYSYDYDYLYS